MPHMIDEYPQPWRNRQDDDAEQARVLLEWDESDKRGCSHWLIAGVVALLVAACAPNPDLSRGDWWVYVAVAAMAIVLAGTMGGRR